MKKFSYILLPVFLLMFQSCGIYSFTGADTGAASTFQVNLFQNASDIVEPGIDREFTNRLQDLIQNQTNLSLTNTGGDLVYEGEIVDFYIAPMTATADNNTLEPTKDFERRFSHYYDYGANQLLTGPVLDTALDETFTRITELIFNASLTNW